MIDRIIRGRSFKGVGKYILHDKNANTSNRVTFTETVNLPTANANSAIRHMIDVASHSDDLKRDAGVAMSGRKQEKPVYHFMLAWHPSENLTMDKQIDAAKEALHALGIDDRQALIVGHNDTEHPHVHVVANLVSTENGTFPSLSMDYDKLSKWALDYERRHGVVFCKEREKNQERRMEGEFVKDQSMSPQEWRAWKKQEAAKIWDDFRADKAAARDGRKGQYDALWRQKEERFALRKDEIKQVFKPHWRDLFKAQRQELKEFDNHLVSRMKFALRQSKEGRVKAIFQAVFSDPKQRMELIAHHEKIRGELGQTQKGRIADASREVTKAYKYDLAQLKDAHKQQDQERYDQTKAKSAEVWKTKDITKTGQDFDRTADRRKDDETRSVFDKDLANDEAENARKRNREKIRKRKERKRNRPRRRGDTGRTMDR